MEKARTRDMFDLRTAAIACVGCVIFTAIHKLVNDKVLLACVPASVRSKILQKKEEDPDFARTCRANGSAFLHAIVVNPLAIYCILFDPIITANPWTGRSWALVIAGWIMLAYFGWDILICCHQFKVYGVAFFLHAILSFTGLFCHFSLVRDPSRSLPYEFPCLGRHVAFFMASEISTPFLHIRWMLIQGKATKTKLFKFMNIIFLSTYLSYRLCLIHITSLVPFYNDLIYARKYTPQIPVAHLCLLMFIFVVWTLLNTYWGILLLDSQVKQIRKPPSVAIDAKKSK